DVRVLNRMTKDEAARAGVEDGNERAYFRVDADGNLAPPAATEWLHITSQELGNGDYIGVATPWKWPDTFANVTVSDLRRAQEAVSAGKWRESPQSSEWAGIAVARVMNLDPDNKAAKAKITALLKAWIKNGMFVVVEGEDDSRRKRKFIEVGNQAND